MELPDQEKLYIMTIIKERKDASIKSANDCNKCTRSALQ